MTYNKIKQSALKLFAQKGFDGTTIKDIAGQSGLKPSSIYSHIASKEELFIIIWKECMQNAGRSIEGINNYVINNKNYNAEKILFQYYSTIIHHFINNRAEYLFLRQTSFFTKMKESLNDNKFTNFMISQSSINYFKMFFIKLKQDEKIIEESDENLYYIYIGSMIAYLEEKIVYNIPLGDEFIHIFWTGFWQSITE